MSYSGVFDSSSFLAVFIAAEKQWRGAIARLVHDSKEIHLPIFFVRKQIVVEGSDKQSVPSPIYQALMEKISHLASSCQNTAYDDRSFAYETSDASAAVLCSEEIDRFLFAWGSDSSLIISVTTEIQVAWKDRFSILHHALQEHEPLFSLFCSRYGAFELGIYFEEVSHLVFFAAALCAGLSESLHLLLDAAKDIGKIEKVQGMPGRHKHPKGWEHLVAKTTVRCFSGILTAENLNQIRVVFLQTYVHSVKQQMEKMLAARQVFFRLPEVANVDRAARLFDDLDQVLTQSQSLGEEIQAKLFFEFGTPILTSLQQLLPKES